MAILSNGKFSGFLCSVKESGRKLKNGAKAMVEDFLSGFNGHGWKLWKRGDSWRLELDELLVRKSFQVFELIINQITSIKGSQAITQGHAKIKEVTIVESADVYKEVTSYTYPNDFKDGGWYSNVADGTIDTPFVITTDSISILSQQKKQEKWVVGVDKKISAMTVKAENVTGAGFLYDYFDNEGALLYVEITKDGIYNLPKSFAGTGTNIVAGFTCLIGSTGTIKQEHTSASYTEKIVQEPCYRIQIDDELNSITEYDLIRCQKGDKFYYVQVGSVFQYYINIPISEFDSDSETGTILNPPSVGDELVQFGNVSHQDKYASRHSAIYLHVDDNEPAIDLMTDIYSKDWSKGNILKTRLGGNLPGTDGDRGLYSVNGKLLFVDEQGNTVSVINPDGSASFARGQISWTKDGNPYFRGYIISGDAKGKRIEINPSTGSIDIYDEGSKLVNSIEGKKYADPLDFFQSNIPDFIVNTNLIGFVINYFPFEMTNFLFKDNNGNHGITITDDDSYYLYYSHDISFKFDSGTYNAFNLTLNLILEKDDGTITVLDTEEYTEPKTYWTEGLRVYTLPKIPGYYTPKLSVKITGDTVSYFSFSGKVTQNNSYIRNLKYKSSFFSQGLALGTDDSNVAMIWNSTKEQKTGNVLVDLENKRYGLRINTYGVSVKYGYFANRESYWMSITPIFAHVKINKYGDILSQSTFFSKEYQLSCEKVSVGFYKITIPSEIMIQFQNMIPFAVISPELPSPKVPIVGYANIGGAIIHVTTVAPSGVIDSSFSMVLYAVPISFNANKDFVE